MRQSLVFEIADRQLDDGVLTVLGFDDGVVDGILFGIVILVIMVAVRSINARRRDGFYANAAWTVIATLAHNLLRWTHLLALPDTTIRTAATLRRRLITIPGRLARTARRTTLRMPARWPWATDFLAALARIRALPPPV